MFVLYAEWRLVIHVLVLFLFVFAGVDIWSLVNSDVYVYLWVKCVRVVCGMIYLGIVLYVSYKMYTFRPNTMQKESLREALVTAYTLDVHLPIIALSG